MQMEREEISARILTQAVGTANVLLERSDLADEISEALKGVFLDDLREDVKSFLRELNLLTEANLDFPAVREIESGAESLLSFGEGTKLQNLRNTTSRDLARSLLRPQKGRAVVTIKRDHALDTFHEGLAEFLAVRIASSRDPAMAPGVLGVALITGSGDPTAFGVSSSVARGFKIRVSTKTPSLRVHVAKKFYRNNWTYFGYPTSPVENVIPGGIYFFGVDDGPYAQITEDPAEFNIPYSTVSPRLTL